VAGTKSDGASILAGELCGLQISDFDFERGLVRVNRSVWRGKLQSTKSEHPERCFALSPQLVYHLKEYLRRWTPNEKGWLFATRNGTPWDQNLVVKRKAANAVFKKLSDSGYEVFPVNPNAEVVEGAKCYANVMSVPGKIDGVVIATHPQVSASIVGQCKERGVTRVWFHRSFGEGSISEDAIRECGLLGMEHIVGGCPLMFLRSSGSRAQVYEVVAPAAGASSKVTSICWTRLVGESESAARGAFRLFARNSSKS